MNIIEAAKVIKHGGQVFSKHTSRKLARLVKNDRILSIKESGYAHGLSISDLLVEDYEVVDELPKEAK